jgi:hypothetical protein
MAIRLTHNPYQGVNAHFHSFMQNAPDSWSPFHQAYIIYLGETLNHSLPTGYFAVPEQSLQVQMSPDLPVLVKSQPDVAVVSEHERQQSSLTPTSSPVPTLEVTAELEELEDALSALAIYQMSGEEVHLVTRIEVLSPTNKRKPADYLPMRVRTLRSGVNMVEIDYRHQTPNIYRAILPDYAAGDNGSYPYCIAITLAHDELATTRFYCFHVDEPIPELPIPLAGEEEVRVDFDAVYQRTFANDRRAHHLLDYSQPPRNPDSYLPLDRARIEAVMARLRAEAEPD